ncbi:MAG: hypothetical protein KKA62_02320 [Nanoarchaeota archaeon]|nr:hypothetical protein [Nanoarchaeota archaeon]MBU1643670.1 hypothetical protein [Nanoarchaeota archaeon]MBU1976768.1 hypothetical protein [Nanoarchaeota archaeon]
MKKPYLKKHSKIDRFDIWIVDGNYIRSNINLEFTNFGQHYRFNFIPKNEFWIDKEYGEEETEYFVQHLLVENKLMGQGKNYETALEQASIFEKAKRHESESIEKYRKDPLNAIRKRFLKNYSKKAQVWIVNGKLVRDFFYTDFTEGGHDLVYSFVPKNEIWIDDDIGPRERKLIILHEFHERNLMFDLLESKKKDVVSKLKEDKIRAYHLAHEESNKLEHSFRQNPGGMDQRIRMELNKFIKIK